MASLTQNLVVSPERGTTAPTASVHLMQPDGSPYGVATLSKCAGDTPTKAEFDALVDAFVAAGMAVVATE